MPIVKAAFTDSNHFRMLHKLVVESFTKDLALTSKRLGPFPSLRFVMSPRHGLNRMQANNRIHVFVLLRQLHCSRTSTFFCSHINHRHPIIRTLLSHSFNVLVKGRKIQMRMGVDVFHVHNDCKNCSASLGVLNLIILLFHFPLLKSCSKR